MGRQAMQARQFYNQSCYREQLLYVNDHVRPGDGVYVYWNMRPTYEYYHDAYQLRYTAVEGSYVKSKATSQADYLRRLQPDFAPLRGKHRLRYVHEVNLRDGVGDFVERPAWYFDPQRMPGWLLNGYFATLGRRVDSCQRQNFAAMRYAFPAPGLPAPGAR